MTAAELTGPRFVLPIFLREVYAPGLHLAYAAAWFVALQAALCRVAGLPWQPGWSMLLGIATLFLVLFYLRVADEWKDLDYDRVHNPDRPLVRGMVTLREVRRYLWGSAVLVAALNLAWGTPWALAIALADMAWALVLVPLERCVPRVRDGMLLNLLVTYPVNVALSLYTYALWLGQYQHAPDLSGAGVLLCFALAFLVYELLRKMVWPVWARAGERLYTQALGPGGAVLAVLGCALGAVLPLFVLLQQPGDTALSAPLAAWVMGPALLPAIWAVARFLMQRQRRVKLTSLGMGFLLLFYGGLCSMALAEWALRR